MYTACIGKPPAHLIYEEKLVRIWLQQGPEWLANQIQSAP